jgi:hypothetical protein
VCHLRPTDLGDLTPSQLLEAQLAFESFNGDGS